MQHDLALSIYNSLPPTPPSTPPTLSHLQFSIHIFVLLLIAPHSSQSCHMNKGLGPPTGGIGKLPDAILPNRLDSPSEAINCEYLQEIMMEFGDSLYNPCYNVYWLTFVQLSIAIELMYSIARSCPSINILQYSYPFTKSYVISPSLTLLAESWSEKVGMHD